MDDRKDGGSLYRDMAQRTQGELYIGVTGPVRTGKSTFIAGFLQKLVLPMMENGQRKTRLEDEMPQSATGRAIMTTQPKFIPGEGAALIHLEGGVEAKVRMVDSVGYLVPGATGTKEGEKARMVSTPWAEHDLPFEEAAEIGTRKVMEEHATLGILITTDGTITDIPRSAYEKAEEKAISSLKASGKPFVAVLNTAKPESESAKQIRSELEEKYDIPFTLLNVKDMTLADIRQLLSKVLMEFPVREIRFSLPDWVSALDENHWLCSHIFASLRELSGKVRTLRDRQNVSALASSPYLLPPRDEKALPGEGVISYTLPVREGLFNKILSEQCGADISDDRCLLTLLKELMHAKREYDRISGALEAVNQTGYGLVCPSTEEITLDAPQLMQQGGRYGVRLHASAPTLHIIRSDIETEVTPVLGNQAQSEDFVAYLDDEYKKDPQSLWNTNFFGKSLQELVKEGLSGKLNRMPPDVQEKVQAALGKILNEGDGGVICILL